ncbi:methyltransferase domain-containing protein [Streptomyces sp. UH6]|uniref:class I SAM-dependent methyltransferase n=1 Tax=Streptomyces sp. UH6 TaxID=2748379 RepID=UPI0015D512FE|nr:methyltransferase domain-containing protein [Streptomyces sp. UH6]NYV74001.1 methyltransferase domain-containing protein [Streptomyces sp. UH6]
MDETVAPWTWDDDGSDEEFRCARLTDTGVRAPFRADDLAALDVCGVQFGSWDGRVSGWLNTDAVGLRCGEARTETGRVYRVDDTAHFVQADARHRLPFADGATPWVYAEHFIEHLTLDEGIRWLREVGRILTPGGLLRLTTPDLARYVDGYRLDDGFYATHRERLLLLGAPPDEVPERRAFTINQIFHFHGHRWIYDEDELSFALTTAGFPAAGIVRRAYREGAEPAVAALDRQVRNDETLYVEARSPDGR